MLGLIEAALGLGALLGLVGGAFRVANNADHGYIVNYWPSFWMCAIPTAVVVFLLGGAMLLFG
jgi:hypothetical protein